MGEIELKDVAPLERLVKPIYDQIRNQWTMPAWNDLPADKRLAWVTAAKLLLIAHEAHLKDSGLVIVPEVPSEGMSLRGLHQSISIETSKDLPRVWLNANDYGAIYTAMVQAYKEG